MNDDMNPIIRFRKPTNQTSIDYREKFSLQSKHILKVRELSHLCHDEEEVQIIVTALLVILSRVVAEQNESLDENENSIGSRFDMDLFRTQLGLSRELSFGNENDAMSCNDSHSSSSISIASSCLSNLDSLSSSSKSVETDLHCTSSRTSSYCSTSSRISSSSSHSNSMVESLIDELSSSYFSSHSLEGMSTFSQEPNDYRNIMSIFATMLGCSILDLDDIVTSIIDITAIRQREWDSVRLSTNSAKKNRTIDELDSQCYHCTRFNPEELHTLKDIFFGAFASDTVTFKENKFTYEEAMLISLTYMAHGMPYMQMRTTFGHDWTRYSYMIEWYATFLYHKFYHRLSGRSLEYWATHYNIDDLREKIFNYVCFDEDNNRIEGLEDVTLQRFRIFAWIDCMMCVTSRPGGGPINAVGDRRDNEDELQRAFFTSYGHQWGMKNQGIFLPNGMLGGIYTTSIAQNDKGVVNISGIAEELERVLRLWKINLPHGSSIFPAVHGDDIYDISTVIVKRIRGTQ